MHSVDEGPVIVFSQGGPVLLLILPVVHLGLCYAVGKYAENKGNSFWLGALLSFFASPLIGIIVVAIIASNNSTRVAR